MQGKYATWVFAPTQRCNGDAKQLQVLTCTRHPMMPLYGASLHAGVLARLRADVQR